MITELKKKQSKFGTIIASLGDGETMSADAANLESMNAFSAFVTIHLTDKAFQSPAQDRNGITYFYQKSGPKLKQAIGHHLSMVRGDQIFALVLPSVKLLEDITRVYQFADANRMERAYGFFVGNSNQPSVVAFTGALAEHLFHAVPDNMEMVGDEWLKWVHQWASRAMMAHRYFDANKLVAIAVLETAPAEPISEASMKSMAKCVEEVLTPDIVPQTKLRRGRQKKNA